MGRSTSSCFKIITCGGGGGGDPLLDNDDYEPLESKSLADKRRWSFRKRSSRHRVLSNTVISETLPSGHKETPESTTTDFHAQTNPSIPGKTSLLHWDNETVLWSTSVESNKADHPTVPESISKTDTCVSGGTAEISIPSSTTDTAIKINHELEVSAAVVIQTAVREYMAQRALFKLKNVVKLQAAVRGHLVRRQAVGTLRCVQAIIKMQALVRARRSSMSLHGSGKENSGTKANKNHSSTEKFLSNGFARQLLESTQMKKQIHVKCEPSKQDSAWKWLERWMSVSQAEKLQASPEFGEGEKISTAAEVETGIPSEVVSDLGDLKSTLTKTAIPLEGEENLITYDADNFDFHAYCPTHSTKDDMQQPHLDDGLSKAQETCSTIFKSQIDTKLDATSSKSPISFSSKPEVDNQQARRSVKRLASEQPETEGKKFVFGSRKACNPTFTAVQSKFEELTSSAISGQSNNSSQGAGQESKLESISSSVNSVTKIKEFNIVENSVSHEPRVRVGGSDCGTELSISSTLDSPDRSEVGREEIEHAKEAIERMTYEPNAATTNASSLGNPDTEAKKSSSISGPNLLDIVSQQGKLEVVKGEYVEQVDEDYSLLERQLERSASEVQEAPADLQTCRSSLEGSPRSHMTVPESHGTPSSQVSVKAKRNKVDKSGSSQKRKSLSDDKRSPSNPTNDSNARNSSDLFPEDSKNGRRRNSFGSPRPEHVEQEPRDSNSNSLPNYMQATKSARAKAHANNSPRSSPDVLDKDVNVKKRHSLPGANGKQVSPRIQRSMSQVQQGANERKWQR